MVLQEYNNNMLIKDDNSEKRVSKLHSYYFNENTESVCTDSSDNSAVRKLINKYEYEDATVERKENTVSCKLCDDKSCHKDNYIILSCNHMFHIGCLAESHFEDVYKYPVLDNEYFLNRRCNSCQSSLGTEEIMYLHSKFLSNTKNTLTKHQETIDDLETKLNKIKSELRTCYEYKHKMEQEREKSKQIVSILSTML